MAIVYKLDEGATHPPQSEREVLGALARLSDDWIVFHSVRWQSLRAGRQGDGEADFLVAHRKHGLVVLEVKGGGIVIEDGRWTSVDRHGHSHAIKNPYVQATHSKHALLAFLSSFDQSLAQIPIVHAVAFPDVETHVCLGPVATPEITLFSSDLTAIEEALLRVFRHWGASRPFSSGQLDRLVTLLAPTVTIERTLSIGLRKTEAEIVRLTESQQRGFARLRAVSRLLVSGGPGTGKTLLAIERARLLSEQGARVLMVCYNELLSRVIRHHLASCLGVEVSTFHHLCTSALRQAGMTTPSVPDQSWWDVEAAKELEATFAAKSGVYDAVIVDEGQDFSPLWFKTLSAGLSDPEHGPMYVFADDRQELWRRDWHSGLKHFGELELSDNCRNSAPIVRCMNAIFGTASPPGAAEGAPVITITYGPGDDLASLVLELSQRLMEDQEVEASELTILVDEPRLAERLRNAYVGEQPVVGFGGDGVVCESVSRFKGLESPVVLLVLSRSHDVPSGLVAAFVGLSRARAAAVILMPSDHPAARSITEAAGRR
ncbi:NERD domain-containing protein/DEAD/DEAH box helicase [Rhodanobacter sp. PCA2]|uniref:nuclease-related domain-containing DEAD/DEAH box helicase n=1 Tax=Rhodanobacter sp. PCA2 TaxID=2006117 RepID=UPI0015E646EE|nr:NERD domain-containing protein/DEAD/DEAH box helicase [Rhodanobacter sp. PCA2]